MKGKILLVVCAGLVSVVAVLSAQTTAILDADFEAKLKALKPDDAQGHFRLAMEAFKSGLYEETKAAAKVLQTVDSGDTRAAYLTSAAEYYQSGAFTLPVAVAGPGPLQSEGPPMPGPVGPPPVGPGPGGATDLSDEQVEAIYNEYGQARMNEFRAVQNAILVSRCASNQCHGNPQKSGPFYLKTQNLSDRKVLAENFSAVRNYVNPANLAESRILSVSLAPEEQHPGGPVFRSERDAAYLRLKRWVESLPGLFGD